MIACGFIYLLVGWVWRRSRKDHGNGNGERAWMIMRDFGLIDEIEWMCIPLIKLLVCLFGVPATKFIFGPPFYISTYLPTSLSSIYLVSSIPKRRGMRLKIVFSNPWVYVRISYNVSYIKTSAPNAVSRFPAISFIQSIHRSLSNKAPVVTETELSTSFLRAY